MQGKSKHGYDLAILPRAVKAYIREKGGGELDRAEIYSALSTNVSVDELEEAIEELKRVGELYEPKIGRVKIV